MMLSTALVDERSIFSFSPRTTKVSTEQTVSEATKWQRVHRNADLDKCPAEIHCPLPDGITIGTHQYSSGGSDHGLYTSKFFKARTTISKGAVKLVRREIGAYKWMIDANGVEQRLKLDAISTQGTDYKLIVDPSGTEYAMNIHKHLSHLSDDVLVLTPFAGFINHSCDPNCFGIIDEEEKKHRILALRDIRPNEELTMDYCLSEYDMKGYIRQCECSMPSCRGSCEGFRYLSDYEKQKLAPYANLFIQAQYHIETSSL